MEKLSILHNAKGYQCSDSFKGILTKYLEQDWEPLKYDFFHRLIVICMVIIGIGIMSLVLERSYYDIGKLGWQGNVDTSSEEVHSSEAVHTSQALSSIEVHNSESIPIPGPSSMIQLSSNLEPMRKNDSNLLQ